MSALKDLVKKGWHPEKEGTTLRGQVSSLIGRKQDSASASDTAAQHSSRPLASLKDPSSFAPPPRRTAAPRPPSHTGPRKVVPAPSKYIDPHVGPAASSPPPPRLPPRASSATSTASSRLAAAGVSVPELGVGEAHPRPSASSKTSSSSAAAPASSKTSSSATPALAKPSSSSSPSQGTSWAQKQAALKTASSFHKNPSSVSLTDAKAAASTANNFRQRHGDQIAAGVSSAQGINQKYGISSKINSLAAKHQGQSASVDPPAPASASVAGLAAAKKKPPPPPPPKKSALAASSASPQTDDQPPEIPMSTRPTF